MFRRPDKLPIHVSGERLRHSPEELCNICPAPGKIGGSDSLFVRRVSTSPEPANIFVKNMSQLKGSFSAIIY